MCTMTSPLNRFVLPFERNENVIGTKYAVSLPQKSDVLCCSHLDLCLILVVISKAMHACLNGL